MLIKQINHIASQTLQRCVGDLPDALRAAIHALSWISFLEAELGRYDNRFAERLDRFTNKFLIGEWAVRLSRIEESDSAVEGRSDQRNRLLLISGRAVPETESHAAKADL